MVTTEFENPPAAALEALARRTLVAPSPNAVADRSGPDRREARSSPGPDCRSGRTGWSTVPVPIPVSTTRRSSRPPASATTARASDVVADGYEMRAAWQLLGSVPCVLEQALSLETEFSVVVARTAARRLRVVSGRRELPCRRHPRPHRRAGPRLAAARRSRRRSRHGDRRRTRLRRRAGGRVLRSRRRPARQRARAASRTTAVTGRSTSRRPASSSSRSGRSAGSASATPSMTRPAAAMVNLLGDLWDGGDARLGAGLRPSHRAPPVRQGCCAAVAQDGSPHGVG